MRCLKLLSLEMLFLCPTAAGINKRLDPSSSQVDECLPYTFYTGSRRQAPTSKSARKSRSLSGNISAASSFLELAKARFEIRLGRPATVEEEQWNFMGLQLLRIPKAGSSEASSVARRLGGCTPRGPCCSFPGNPMGSCPSVGLMCYTVIGCVGHKVDLPRKNMLRNPSIFSMSNLRDVVDRMVSGFFYEAPHSPTCAREDIVDYEKCFLSMTKNGRYLNVAARMFTGHYAYGARYFVCMEKHSERCVETLESTLAGACELNFITMTEAWGSSLLLLFETLPWLGPTQDYFPLPRVEDEHGVSTNLSTNGGSRQNKDKKYEEGIQYITPQLRDIASRANAVDEALHRFVSAKFCTRLREVGLINHPLVVEELQRYSKLNDRCTSESWASDTLKALESITPKSCRLYIPMPRPSGRSWDDTEISFERNTELSNDIIS